VKGATQAAARDQETRRRLAETAAHLFAERGFRGVTVREICREAGANVAAVNYHFRNKMGLYLEVVRTAIEAMRDTSQALQAAGQGLSTEERLRGYIRVYLQRLLGQGRASWIHGLMQREMADPTPALDLIVNEAIRPRVDYVRSLVSDLMARPPRDARVTRLVAGIHAECLFAQPNPVTARLAPDFRPSPRHVEEIADHITVVALAGIRALAAPPASAPACRTAGAPAARRRRRGRR